MSTTTYTFTPAIGQCAATTTLTINVNPYIIPNFLSVDPICAGATLNALPTTSIDGVIGTWSPTLDNTVTTVYVFTPTPGQCANKAELKIEVIPNIIPTFKQVGSICVGKILAGLPTNSINGVIGTWLPAVNSLATTTYTFTANSGQCSADTTMTIVVNPSNFGGTVSGGTTICRFATSGLLTLSGHNGAIIRWESSIDNFVTTTNIPNTFPIYTSGSLNLTTKFRAVIQGVCGIAYSESTTVTPVILASSSAMKPKSQALP